MPLGEEGATLGSGCVTEGTAHLLLSRECAQVWHGALPSALLLISSVSFFGVTLKRKFTYWGTFDFLLGFLEHSFHFHLFFCSLCNCLLSSCCVLRAILNVRNPVANTACPLRSWYGQCGVRSEGEKQACFITTSNHRIMKDFKHPEKLKVLSFWNDRCSAELTVFTDTTANVGVTQRCQPLLLRVSGVKTHIARIWIEKSKWNVGVCSAEGWESQTFSERGRSEWSLVLVAWVRCLQVESLLPGHRHRGLPSRTLPRWLHRL